MHTPQTNEPDDEKLQASKKLVAALRKLPGERVFVPPYINETVLHAARERLEKPQKKNQFRWRIIWATATAAIVLLAALTHVFINTGSQSEFAREDINRDGRVDILDAFALARRIESGHISESDLDFNGDGVIDRNDSEAIANHAVRLGKGDRT
jgi:hypothetical protein